MKNEIATGRLHAVCHIINDRIAEYCAGEYAMKASTEVTESRMRLSAFLEDMETGEFVGQSVFHYLDDIGHFWNRDWQRKDFESILNSIHDNAGTLNVAWSEEMKSKILAVPSDEEIANKLGHE